MKAYHSGYMLEDYFSTLVYVEGDDSKSSFSYTDPRFGKVRNRKNATVTAQAKRVAKRRAKKKRSKRNKK